MYRIRALKKQDKDMSQGTHNWIVAARRGHAARQGVYILSVLERTRKYLTFTGINAIIFPYSNGLAEGKLNKLKQSNESCMVVVDLIR